MQELEPSPVEETPPPYGTQSVETNAVQASQLEYFPSSKGTTNVLGVRSSSVPKILTALQKYSTVPPTTYLVMHYANTAVIPLVTRSIQESERLLLLTRPYYQSFPLEPLLIYLPIATHVLSGLGLRLYRRSIAAKRYGAETSSQRHQMRKNLWPALSLTSALGYALVPLMLGHVLVNRIMPQQVYGDSSTVGLRYFSYGMQKHPWLANIGYTLMLGTASFHFVTGTAKYLKWSREYVTEGGDYGARKRKTRGRLVSGIAAIVATVWIAGGLGVVGRGIGGALPAVWESKEWDRIYQAIPLVGAWI